MASMNNARAFFGACPIQNEFIYVFGGLDGFLTICTIEKYHSVLNSWSILRINLP